ncbi:MAG: ABC-F family ATP-binding cassette domain-containing protein [Chitinophagales bacterium]|nr:ABC-F family ATP-binding cassette domain-containing protein [Chitinophagales bacterium]
MNYLNVENLTKYYGEKLLFKDISFDINKGQKIALIAKNGTGKSSIIKIIQGLEPAESGTYLFHKDIRVGFLTQEPNYNPNQTVYDTILQSKHPKMETCLQYELALKGNGNLENAMKAMDEINAWDYEQQIQQILSKFLIHDLQAKISMLSGGQIKRLALAILLLQEPDFLILDEPTNHLDIDMIEWLENYLNTENKTLLMITHDRYFLENICTDILEIDNGILYKHKGNYSKYLENKAIREENQQINQRKAFQLYKKELDWMRKQPKARTTKSKSRVDNFENVTDASKKINKDDAVDLQIQMNRIGGKILELYNINKSYQNKIILKDFNYKFQKGERIGIVGNNGCGKSTFLKIITEQEKIDSGKIVVGDTIVFGYYNQDGIQLKADKRIIEVVRDIADFIPTKNGNITASQLLEKFLFSPEQQYQFVSTLSGGEKRRLYLLTVLMTNPNFLILDEPTNDLDILTLNVLEDFLLEFKGCLIIVSHDRYFLDKLTDWLFVFEGNGKIENFIGNYKDYKYQKKQELKQEKQVEKEQATKVDKPKDKPKQKLSYKEKIELEQLEKEIPILQTEKENLSNKLSSGITNHEEIQAISVQLQTVVEDLETKEWRWLELSELA